MNQPTRRIISRMSKAARRAMAACIITGCCLSSSGFAGEPNDAPDKSIHVQPQMTSNVLDYWIFSDDYCGWASAEPLVRNLAIAEVTSRPQSSETNIENIIAQDLINKCIAQGLSHAKYFRSKPTINTESEGYLSYDLNRADQIAMRMYPITIPQFTYVGSRRSASSYQAALARGPLDCLGNGVVWNEAVLPSQSVTVSSTPRKSQKLSLEELSQLRCVLEKEVAVAHSQADAKRRELAFALADAMDPQSPLRKSIDPEWLGQTVGSGLASAMVQSERMLSDATQRAASAWGGDKLAGIPGRESESAGLWLLSRAGVEAETLDTAIAGVAVDVAESVCCPVERAEMAAIPPQNPQYAAIGVAAATLSLPQECELAPHPIAQAEAIATACDTAAAALEQWARALRRAGDSVVRVARGSVKEETTLR